MMLNKAKHGELICDMAVEIKKKKPKRFYWDCYYRYTVKNCSSSWVLIIVFFLGMKISLSVVEKSHHHQQLLLKSKLIQWLNTVIWQSADAVLSSNWLRAEIRLRISPPYLLEEPPPPCSGVSWFINQMFFFALHRFCCRSGSSVSLEFKPLLSHRRASHCAAFYQTVWVCSPQPPNFRGNVPVCSGVFQLCWYIGCMFFGFCRFVCVEGGLSLSRAGPSPEQIVLTGSCCHKPCQQGWIRNRISGSVWPQAAQG